MKITTQIREIIAVMFETDTKNCRGRFNNRMDSMAYIQMADTWHTCIYCNGQRSVKTKHNYSSKRSSTLGTNNLEGMNSSLQITIMTQVWRLEGLEDQINSCLHNKDIAKVKWFLDQGKQATETMRRASVSSRKQDNEWCLFPKMATHFKSWPFMIRKFVHDEVKTFTQNRRHPRHLSIQHRTNSEGWSSGERNSWPRVSSLGQKASPHKTVPNRDVHLCITYNIFK